MRLVWVSWPERREVDVWMPGDKAPRTLQDNDTLDADDIVPGFNLSLDQMW